MEITIRVNGRPVTDKIDPSASLQEFLRAHGFKSVKCACETSGCGACTVLMDGSPVLSCSVLAARAGGHEITTLEGLQDEAKEIGTFIAAEGADQCGFCNPGYIINTIALFRENNCPTDDEIKIYLSGNLCRCTGYEGQMRALKAYRDWRNS